METSTLWCGRRRKRGGNDFKFEEAAIFQNATHLCQMLDLGYVGYDFTWSNNRGGEDNVQERLDRFMANQEWKDLFMGSYVTHLEKRKSDHLPILLIIRTSIEETMER